MNDRMQWNSGDLAASYTQISGEEAMRIAAEVFGLQPRRANRFATEKDDTFHITTNNDEEFVLKVANPSEDPVELDFQVALMRHVIERAPELPVPRAWPARTGTFFPKVVTSAGESRHVRLLTFLRGTPLACTTANAAQREQIGELLAKLRLATADFTHQADSRQMAWDVRRLLELEGLLPFVEDAHHRDALERGLERFRDILPALSRCRMQVLHNDFNQNNIVVDHAATRFVSGIIDFGDAVRTAIAVDVSTAVMNQLPAEVPNDPRFDILSEGRDIVRGYLRLADLTDDELRLIPHLAMGRVITRALLTTWRASLFPENSPYILRNTTKGWKQLDWFLSRSSDEISALLCFL